MRVVAYGLVLTMVFSVVENAKEFTNNFEESSDGQSVFAVAPSNGITHPQQSTNIIVTFIPM